MDTPKSLGDLLDELAINISALEDGELTPHGLDVIKTEVAALIAAIQDRLRDPTNNANSSRATKLIDQATPLLAAKPSAGGRRRSKRRSKKTRRHSKPRAKKTRRN
jgi:hypothetical protein